MWLVTVVIAGCAHAPVAAPTPAAPTEATIRDKSHAVLDAFDRGDIAAVREALASSYVHFEGATPRTRGAELEQMAKRKPDAPHIGSRAWQKEYVFVHPDSAVFIGRAAETAAGNEVHGGYSFEGWYTLQWRREADAWHLALWTWRRAGSAAERDTWNEIFRNGTGFTKEPNRLLVDTVAGVKPGRALDLAMGQGRNALYLASQGWHVTGVDFSAEGIRIAREGAAARDLTLDAVYADVSTYDLGVDRWDLVTMIYAGDDATWIDKIKPSLRPGGLFVYEYFQGDDDSAGDDSFARGELAKRFGDGFEIVRDEIVEDVPDWAVNRASLARFVARKK